jgi:hypothetical protein
MNMNDVRECWYCGNEISACFGYVLARDFVAFCEGKNDMVRETCYVCVAKCDFGVLNLEEMLREKSRSLVGSKNISY